MVNQAQNLSPQLMMYRESLSNLPDLNIPQGYELRSFCPGDEKWWERIINVTFQYQSDFKKEILMQQQFKPERIKFICCNNIPIATATAWEKDDYGKEIGYLHMVGVLPEHSGKKLGYYVSLAALYQMAKEGKKSAVLHTDDFRIPAIKTYWNLGFKPVLVHENQIERWKNISLILNMPEIFEKLTKNMVM
ncbi:GNAT family N-acetyltransferase [Caldicoprobacter algeriensis]|uniref:GNAT family N-acetyltransferase n=1 Tax=Caldicoprobacter algeriensis TaxID=699281 RepID=UPI00207AA774|nr:GNAT family N-acetyltransferase [Caldicoprobacter algeriensis]